jgi:serine/threonine-protein kinase HipA
VTGPVAADELRAVEAADVYKAGQLAGRIVRDDDDSVFSYVPDYLADVAVPPVAFTLPKVATPVRTGAGSVPPFFAGLLPEGARLTAMTAATRTSADDQLTLLLAVGEDTVGDVQVRPTDVAPTSDGYVLAEKDIADTTLAAVFARAISAAPGDLDRVGLPGVQVKVSAQMMSAVDKSRASHPQAQPGGLPATGVERGVLPVHGSGRRHTGSRASAGARP